MSNEHSRNRVNCPKSLSKTSERRNKSDKKLIDLGKINKRGCKIYIYIQIESKITTLGG